MALTTLLAALAMGAPVGDRLLMVSTLSSQDWAQLANDSIALGEERAVTWLVERSKRPKGEGSTIFPNTRAVLLARLLFEPRDKEPLRRPSVGFAAPPNDDPKMPFLQQDGVIFLLSEDNGGMGGPERCENYIAYCRQKGQFRQKPYKVPTPDEAKAALAKLYAGPLGPKVNRTFLDKQTSPAEF